MSTNDTSNYLQEEHMLKMHFNRQHMCCFWQFVLNWAPFASLANLQGHFLQRRSLFPPSELPRDSVWTSNVSCYQRRESTGSGSCWPHVRITVDARSAEKNTSSLTGNEARIWHRVNTQTEPSAAGENTQTRLLDRPITGQITATGDAGRGVCLARLANRNRTECFSVRCYLPIVCNSVSNTEDGLKTPTSVTLGRFSCQSISKSWKACRWLVSKKANVLIYSFFNRNTKALSGVINLQWKDQPKWGSDSLWRSASTQLPSLWWNVK